MNGSPHVRETTKSRVVKAIAELDYTPNAVARKLSTGDTGSIGFLVPDIENPFFTHLLRGITDAADKHGYNIFLCSTEDSAEKERRFLESMRAERRQSMFPLCWSTAASGTAGSTGCSPRTSAGQWRQWSA